MHVGIEWLFFDIGSTIIDEGAAYGHRIKDIADLGGMPYETIYNTAIDVYKQNKKGDIETAKFFGIETSGGCLSWQ